MTGPEMVAAIDRAESFGHEWILLTIRRKAEPKNYDRVRVAPGLYGRVVSWIRDDVYLVDIRTADARRVFGGSHASGRKRSGER